MPLLRSTVPSSAVVNGGAAFGHGLWKSLTGNDGYVAFDFSGFYGFGGQAKSFGAIGHGLDEFKTGGRSV